MLKEGIARVVEILLDKYILNTINDEKIEALVKGNIKKRGNILVGDIVEFAKSYDKYVITNVKERVNTFIRPPVANITHLVIVLSLDNPKPDYMLLDKELILCKSKNIEPIICISKVDLANNENRLNDELKYVKKIYSSNYNVIFTSSYEKVGINELKAALKNKVSAFSGNSGVGKSSVIKEIIGDENYNIDIGNIGKKSGRGKHTTKAVKLYEFEKNSYILDTPGFSSYELYDVKSEELKNYYKEFEGLKCDFDDCMHVNEKENVCAIKKAVKEGKIDLLRYERYVYIYTKLKEIELKKYKK